MTSSAFAQSNTGRLLNISTRSRVQVDNQKFDTLVGGFIITGGSKRVLVRGLGPSLSNRGIAQPLPDPLMLLYRQNDVIADNNNWADTQGSEIEATSVAPSNSFEAAIVRTLAPDGYTASIFSIAHDGLIATGTALVEIYDLDPSSSGKLANLSSRGVVGTGDDVMIGGLMVGQGSVKVLIRSIGPDLAVPTSSRLPDPILEIYNTNGDIIGSNDDWQQSQRAAIEATTLAPRDTRDAAILQTFAPGAYTAIVRGKNNTTGEATVEFYVVN